MNHNIHEARNWTRTVARLFRRPEMASEVEGGWLLSERIVKIE